MAREHGGRQRDSHATAGEHIVDFIGLGLIHGDRPPGGELVAERQHAIQVRRDELAGHLVRQRFDARGARQRNQRYVEAVGVEEAGPLVRRL